MGACTPGIFSGNSSFRNLDVEQREMHYLREPKGFSSGMAWGNLGYQMQYSVESLERQLADEGNPHTEAKRMNEWLPELGNGFDYSADADAFTTRYDPDAIETFMGVGIDGIHLHSIGFGSWMRSIVEVVVRDNSAMHIKIALHPRYCPAIPSSISS